MYLFTLSASLALSDIQDKAIIDDHICSLPRSSFLNIFLLTDLQMLWSVQMESPTSRFCTLAGELQAG